MRCCDDRERAVLFVVAEEAVELCVRVEEDIVEASSPIRPRSLR